MAFVEYVGADTRGVNDDKRNDTNSLTPALSLNTLCLHNRNLLEQLISQQTSCKIFAQYNVPPHTSTETITTTIVFAKPNATTTGGGVLGSGI